LRRLTVEDGATEETDELEEHVLLLGDELVPAGELSAALDLGLVQAMVEVGVEPVIGSDKGRQVGARALATKLPPRPLLALFRRRLLPVDFRTRVPVGINVLYQTGVERAVLVKRVVWEERRALIKRASS
jgi:hypothetical protein